MQLIERNEAVNQTLRLLVRNVVTPDKKVELRQHLRNSLISLNFDKEVVDAALKDLYRRTIN